MKFTVDVDCTPEEARRFIGLPDLGPVHDAYISRMRELMEGGISPDMFAGIVKSWGPMSDAGTAMWRSVFEQLGIGSPTNKPV